MEVSGATKSPVPGTVQLVDLDGTLEAKHASGLQKDVVLVPAPSDDPDDPLNWSARRKALSTVCISVYTFGLGTASSAIYSVLHPIEQDTGLTLNDLNDGTGYMFLMFGLGCLFWQPLALEFGKRPVYLVSILATTAITIWVPYTKTNGQWIASKLLQGFFGAPVESLCEISVTDVYFLHERGTYLALYGFFLIGSNFLAPILAGFINEGQGWQWVLYWCAILCGISFIFLCFFMEETNYYRAAGVVDRLKGENDCDPTTPTSPAVGQRSSADEKNQGELDTVPAIELEAGSVLRARERKPCHSRLKLISQNKAKTPKRMRGMILRPLIYLTFPVILYAGFSYGSSLIWFNVLNGTTSLVLSATPYGFSSSIVGLAYLAPLIGVFLAFVYTGTFGDWFVLKLARRNGGLMQAEYRLWLFSLSLLFVPGGLLLWGVGAAHNVHWFGLIFAMGSIGFTNTIGLQLSVNYCIDSYRELSSEAIVSVIVVRNCMSFAVGYGITPWVTNMGLQNAFILAAFAGLAQVLTVSVFLRYGKRMRQASVERYLRYKRDMVAAGLTK